MPPPARSRPSITVAASLSPDRRRHPSVAVSRSSSSASRVSRRLTTRTVTLARRLSGAARTRKRSAAQAAKASVERAASSRMRSMIRSTKRWRSPWATRLRPPRPSSRSLCSQPRPSTTRQTASLPLHRKRPSLPTSSLSVPRPPLRSLSLGRLRAATPFPFPHPTSFLTTLPTHRPLPTLSWTTLRRATTRVRRLVPARGLPPSMLLLPLPILRTTTRKTSTKRCSAATTSTLSGVPSRTRPPALPRSKPRPSRQTCSRKRSNLARWKRRRAASLAISQRPMRASETMTRRSTRRPRRRAASLKTSRTKCRRS